MWLLADHRIDRIIGYQRVLMLGGSGWIAVLCLLPRGWVIGGFTAFMLFALGLFGFAFRKWRTDPGLWMLALLVGGGEGTCCAYFEYLQYDSLFNQVPAAQAWPRGWDEFRFAVDAAISLALLGKLVRFAISVAVRNWQLTHKSRSLKE